MKLVVRPSTAADAPAIVALFNQARLRPTLDPSHLHWKYWQPRTDWPGPQSYVLADGSNILAHAGLVPGGVLFGDDRIRLVQMIDWAARSDAAGAGVLLMKHVVRLVDGLLSIGGGPDTRRLLPHLGFRSCGEVTGYVRTLRPLRMLGPGAELSWWLLLRLARSALWRLTAPSGGMAGWQARRVRAGELHQLASVCPAPTREMAVLERSEGLWQHTLTCPILPLELHVLERAGRTHGYFLLALAPGQVRLADCWIKSSDPADWRSLVQCAVDQARRSAHAAEIVAWSNDALLSRCLLDCGFHPRNVQPVALLLRNGRILPAATLRVQMLDTDAAYLDHNRMALWA